MEYTRLYLTKGRLVLATDEKNLLNERDCLMVTKKEMDFGQYVEELIMPGKNIRIAATPGKVEVSRFYTSAQEIIAVRLIEPEKYKEVADAYEREQTEKRERIAPLQERTRREIITLQTKIEELEADFRREIAKIPEPKSIEDRLYREYFGAT